MINNVSVKKIKNGDTRKTGVSFMLRELYLKPPPQEEVVY
jgi:hypothetical protein